MEAPIIDDPEKPVRGLLLIVDLLPEEDGWNVIKEEIKNVSSFFESKLLYQVEHKGIDVDWKSIKKVAKRVNSVLLLQFDVLTGTSITEEKIEKKFKLQADWEKKSNSNNWIEKNKIWIQHDYKEKDSQDAADVPDNLDRMPQNTHAVRSKIEGPISEIKETESLFFEALKHVLKKGAHEYKIVKIFEEIQKYVELEQYKQYQNNPCTKVFQRVDFKVRNEGSFKLASEPLADPETQDPIADQGRGLFGDVRSILQYEVQEYLQSEPKYKMTKNPRGFCIICNISYDRPGSRVDEARMENLFTQLNFEIKFIRNKRHSVIKAELTAISEQITEEHQSLVLFLMAHGGKDAQNNHQFEDIDSESKSSQYIFEIIGKHKALVGRPKIYFIQTCMGGARIKGENRSGADNDNSGETCFDFNDSQSSSIIIGNGRKAPHMMSDTIIYHATLKGYVSYRNKTKGSRMIKCIDEIFRDHCWHKNIYSLLNSVTTSVSKEPSNQQQWQQPAIHDFSSGDLHLNPGFQEDVIGNYYCNDANWTDTQGNTAWFTVDKKSVIVFDMWNPLLLKVLEFQGPNEPNSIENEEKEEMSIILSGVALDEYTHLVLVYKDSGQKLPILKTCTTYNNNENWYLEDTKLKSQGVLAICEVNQDALGLLVIGIYGLEIHIHGRDFPDIKKNIPLKDTIEVYSESSECILQFSKDTFLVLIDETVRVFNMKGDESMKISGRKVLRSDSLEAGNFFMPCAVTRDKDDSIMVACYNAIHIYKEDNEEDIWEILSDLDTDLDRVNYFCCDKSRNVKIIEIGGPMIPLRIPVIEQGVTSLHSHTLDNAYSVIWPTQDPNIFALGKNNIDNQPRLTDGSGRISFVNSDSGEEYMVALNLQTTKDIRDALWIGGTRHLILTNEAYIVEINTQTKEGTMSKTLEIPQNTVPKKCISISEFEFAILFRFKPGKMFLTCKISTYSKTDFRRIKTVQVKFGYKNVVKSDLGIFAVSPQKGWLIGPVKTNKIFSFLPEGKLDSKKSLDKTRSLVDIRLDEGDGIVLTTTNCEIFRYHNCELFLVTELNTDAKALCYRYNKIYKLDSAGRIFGVYQL